MPTKLLLVFVLTMALTLPAFGQTFGEIRGLITDTSGAVIPGVTITVTNPQTNFTRSATSNDSGYYNFPALLPGIYNVKAELSGFQSEVHNSVELQVQQTARIDFRLKVGAVTDTVEVSAGAPLLNTENATVGTVIENKRIVDLPLNGRSFVSLIALSPNVTSGYTAVGGFADTRGGSDRGRVALSIAGLRREYMYYTLDGVSDTDVDFNTYAFLPSIDALQEFKVQTGIYSAEFGYEASQVNVSTKGGTNAYHGTVFEFLRNNALDARPYAFTSRVPISAPLKWNQFGFTLGGPIQIPKLFNGKDRLFFMSNYEGFRLRNQSQILASVPSVAMRRGDFSELLPTTVIRDPLNNSQPFPGNIIPTQRIHPAAKALLEFEPLPNTGSGFVNNHLELDNNSTDKDQFTQRVDFMESAKSSWFGRYSFQDELKVLAGHFANAASVTDRVRQALISNTRIFSPALVNEFRFGWLGYHNIFATPLAFKRNVTEELGIPLISKVPPIGWGIPVINVTGFTTFGDSLQGPWAADDHTFQWVDNFSWVRGSHSIKFGAEVRRDRYNNTGNQGIRGSFLFQAPTATGYPFGDFLTGYIFRTSNSAGVAISQFRRTNQAYYITDSWKIRPNLTIEAGLRYEFTPVWNSRTPDFTNTIFPSYVDLPTDPRTGILTLPVPLERHPYLARDCAAYGQTDFYPPGILVRFNPAIQTRCVHGLGTTLSPNDLTNWAPRLGLAWSPTPKTTVRAGFGIFYSQDMGNAFFDAVKNLFTQVTPAADTTVHNLTFSDPLGFGGANPCGTSAPFVCISTPVVFLNDPHRRTPYVEQYTLNIQRQLSGSTALEVGYLGSQGHRLEAHLSYNNVVPGPGSVASRSPYPELVNVLPTLSLAQSGYNAGSVKLTRQLSRGLSALLGYTFSKSIDNSSAINPANGSFQGFGSIRQPQTGWCMKCEFGLSDFDSRHRFVASVLYELPVGKGKPFLNGGIASNILGGWQLNNIVSKSSGFPSAVLVGANQSRSNANSDRPDAVPSVSWKLDHPTTDQWFNIQAFRLQPLDTFGNLGRNVVVGPPVFTWDFSTLKNFNFTEQRYFQFRFECFNCANHPVFGDPGQVLTLNQLNSSGFAIPGTGNFGRITSTRAGIDMRQLQFSLKVVF